MSIRFECPKCESVLKIKDALAGTEGKCPKCKTPFTVPDAPSSSGSSDGSSVADTAPATVESATKAAPPKSKARAKVEAPAGGDDDFDPVAFLMEGGGPPKKSASSAPAAGRSGGGAKSKANDDPGGGLSLDDSDTDRKPTAKSKPKEPKPPAAQPEPASAAASANSMLSASSNAKDLLTRTVEESRARAAEMPQESKTPFIDTAQLKMLLFTRILPYGGGTIVLCAVLYWFMSSMIGSDVDVPDELVRAAGVVLINGEPKPGVRITMRPAPDAEDRRWRASTAVTDENGEFEMLFLEGYWGIVPGRQNVSLSYMIDGREMIADEFLNPGKVMTFEEATYDIKLEPIVAEPNNQPAPPNDE